MKDGWGPKWSREGETWPVAIGQGRGRGGGGEKAREIFAINGGGKGPWVSKYLMEER